MFRQLLTQKESRLPDTKLTVHHASVGHVEQQVRSHSKHTLVKFDSLVRTANAEIRNKLTVLQFRHGNRPGAG